ncbi:unnamed protein product [Spodoptera littoralis]|uniref:Nose resistant-to-fluoxetine protein N-terminal domain-containing protein n=1 Tax=Spodoptera littoralis TaxID=7109 RepID=A0A9P0I1I0_SPOLI|nr:unnamed protein product [Spodoptera littoralis]CAH1637993.1 unnamed protein product [Spodoptera littoralis]
MGTQKYFIFLLVAVCTVYGQSSVFDQDLYQNVLDPEECEAQLNFLANENMLRNQFLDASGKIPSNLLGGNWNDLGDYFQCLRIREVIDETTYQGKYCSVSVPITSLPPFDIPTTDPSGTFPPFTWPPGFTLPDGTTLPTGFTPDWLPQEESSYKFNYPPFPEIDSETRQAVETYSNLKKYIFGISGMGEPVESISQPANRVFPIYIASSLRAVLGICIPAVCSPSQTIDFIESRIPYANFTIEEQYCRLPDDKPLAPADIVAIVIFSIIGLLLIGSTTYDLIQTFLFKRAPSRINPLFVSFSVYTNTRRFLTFKSSPGALECVDGIRAISMMWVVVGHTYCMTLLNYVHNLFDTVEWLTSFQATWINSAPITVDTFFLLSGILAVYTVIGKISRTRFIRTIHLFYLNRLLRMFPLLAAVVLLQASAFHHVSDGPYWTNPAHATENCREYWWSALLHIQNYVNPLRICLSQTWYLSVDMQLYIVCPIVLVFCFGSEKLSWCVLTGFVLLSLVSSSLYSFLNNFSAALANPVRIPQFQSYVQTYYLNTLARAPPFFVGMIYGYLLYLCKDKKIRISKFQVIILWALSFIMMAFCIFSIYPVMQREHSAQLFDNFLNAYMRAIWAIGLGWLIFACVHGYGGPINWFLSLQIWKLPARLSYAVYLIHLPIIFTAVGSWVKPYYFTDGQNIYRFMSDFSLSFLFAFILCICIDAPFSTLQKLALGGGKKRPPKETKPPVEESPEVVSATNDRFVKTTL